MRWILLVVLSFSLANIANAASMPAAPQKEQAAALPGHAPAAQGDKIPLAVLEFDAPSGVSAGLKEGVTDRVRYALSKLGTYKIATRKSMEEILKEQDFQQSGRCDDLECIVKVGKIVGVRKMVAGRIVKIGNLYQISMQLVDVETAVIENEVIDTCKGGEENMLQLAGDQAPRLVGVSTKRLPAPVVKMSEELRGAVIRGDITSIEKYLKAGADVNAKSDTGLTPLILASDLNRPELVDFLLQHGADVNARTRTGITPLFMATASKWALINKGSNLAYRVRSNKVIPVAMEVAPLQA